MTGDAVYEEIVRTWSEDRKAAFPRERFQYIERTVSTNDDLLGEARASRLIDGTLRVAEFQEGGRGRRGDRWEAPFGKNLLLSLGLSLPEDALVWTRLPHLVAFCVGSAIESILGTGEMIACKWPNDLYAKGRKWGGILVETVAGDSPFAIVGMGLNVNTHTEDFPPELKEIATSVYELMGCESNRWFLLSLILELFQDHYPSGLFEFEPILDWISKRDFLEGKSIRVVATTGEVSGIARGLGAGGELLLETRKGAITPILSAERIELC
ncbi:MAG: biotin--[acetyl-CoA-carboxylase] ligase [Verrucomicrobiota bacterium]